MTTETQHSWPANAACLGLLALAVASFFPQVVWDGGVFFVQDMMVQNVPFRHFLHEALADWRLPLWEPRINAGFPLYATSAPIIDKNYSNVKNLITEDSRFSIWALPAFL